MASTIVWLRFDLRLADNPALIAAAERGAVLPVFIWAPDEEREWAPGGAHRWWLHHHLKALADAFQAQGCPLILRTGSSLDILLDLVNQSQVDAVYWNERFLPALRQRDNEVAQAIGDQGISTRTFASRLLHDPDKVSTGSGTPYKVFTPFWRRFQEEVTIDAPRAVPKLEAPDEMPSSCAVDDFGLLPSVDWAGGLRDTWDPGEDAAQERLDHFITEIADHYEKARDYPDRDGTSRLSPYLHHGALSPRQVWDAVHRWGASSGHEEAATSYLRELAWREFSYHLLYHFPETTHKPLRDKYADFPWAQDADALRRWQKGQTGFPIVDAGMRQLWATGWMHNRVRMIVASFLTKDLLLPWQSGAAWFWDTLVDGDLANNTMGWQWAAGSGADAQPFFRIFNPISQGEKYDPDGKYVREWVPELQGVPDKYLHAPWTAPAEVLDEADVKLGDSYPEPIVDHAAAREAALEAYDTIR